jgi:hypothetical protein
MLKVQSKNGGTNKMIFIRLGQWVNEGLDVTIWWFICLGCIAYFVYFYYGTQQHHFFFMYISHGNKSNFNNL